MSKDSHLPPFAIRPRFQAELPMTQRTVVRKLRKGFERPEAACVGLATEGYARIKMPEKDRHYWSPQLSIMMEDMDSEEGTLIRGLYGPAPAVWTMFVFFYAFISFVMLFVSIIGFSRMSLDMPAPILWWLPILIIILLSTYLVSFFGQKIGHDQMETLHHFLEESLGLELDAEEGELIHVEK
ncbi:MAG: hypothetical protein AAFZ15_14455 [Bacteroidota bacterium]